MFIPGISEIYVFQASRLPAYVREQHDIGEMPWIALDLAPIDQGPGATAVSEWDQTPEGISQKTELNFISGELPVSVAHDLAFVIVAADGTPYLIGSLEPPFPKLKTKIDLSTPADGKAGYYHTFVWAGPLIPIHFIYPTNSDQEPSFLVPED